MTIGSGIAVAAIWFAVGVSAWVGGPIAIVVAYFAALATCGVVSASEAASPAAPEKKP